MVSAFQSAIKQAVNKDEVSKLSEDPQDLIPTF
jgi:hypothetical protein